MEHVNDWCFRDVYKDGLWEEDLYVCALSDFTSCDKIVTKLKTDIKHLKKPTGVNVAIFYCAFKTRHFAILQRL